MVRIERDGDMLPSYDRRLKCTPAMIVRFAALVKRGHNPEQIAKSFGLGSSTFHKWMSWGKSGGAKQYRQFFIAIEQAIAESEEALVDTFRAGADEDWRAARDFLARRFPERWQPKAALEHSGNMGLALSLAERVSQMPEEELDSEISRLAAEYEAEILYRDAPEGGRPALTSGNDTPEGTGGTESNG